MEASVSCPAPRTPASDEEQLRSLTVLLLDDCESDAGANRVPADVQPGSANDS
jgi:hypothetical protein